jgi:hypothetical protein
MGKIIVGRGIDRYTCKPAANEESKHGAQKCWQ